MWMAVMMLWPPSCDKWSSGMAHGSLNNLESGENERSNVDENRRVDLMAPRGV